MRLESDSVGTLQIPEDAYYGVQTLRGHENFQITGRRVDLRLIRNVVRIKRAAAVVNCAAGKLPETIRDAILRACDDALDHALDGAFITDCIQGGAGTTINMNVNEVIANRATELLGGKKGEYLCHPIDHVNYAQSTNDVIPTAGKLTALEYGQELLEELSRLVESLQRKAKEFDDVLKMGRTQMQDAVPIRLGQEFDAYAAALSRCALRFDASFQEMRTIHLGGSAIGTSVNVPRYYLDHIVQELASQASVDLKPAKDRIDATQHLDCFVAISGDAKALAVALSKLCNDLRLMSSGPLTGFAEITLPPRQNGSSIMPGKINPVIPEVVNQVAFAVIGNDTTITLAAEAGQLELNAFEPVIFYKLFESLACLTNAARTLRVNCIDGIVANKERCRTLLEGSVGMVTALSPHLGYVKTAKLAKEALATRRPLRDLILEQKLMAPETLERILDPMAMTEPEK